MYLQSIHYGHRTRFRLIRSARAWPRSVLNGSSASVKVSSSPSARDSKHDVEADGGVTVLEFPKRQAGDSRAVGDLFGGKAQDLAPSREVLPEFGGGAADLRRHRGGHSTARPMVVIPTVIRPNKNCGNY